MDDDKIERMAMGIIIVIVLMILASLALFSWGFIQFIQWLTSK